MRTRGATTEVSHDDCRAARYGASIGVMRVFDTAGDYPVNGEIYGTAFSQWVDGMRAEFPMVQYGAVGLWTPNDGLQTRHAAPDGVAGLGVGVITNWMEDMLSKTDAVRKADWVRERATEWISLGSPSPVGPLTALARASP